MILHQIATESHGGPWNRVPCTDGTQHVYPAFGPRHYLTDECWCHPVRDAYESSVVVHSVAQ